MGEVRDRWRSALSAGQHAIMEAFWYGGMEAGDVCLNAQLCTHATRPPLFC